MFNSTDMNRILTIQKFVDKTLSLEEATKHLSCSERTIYRLSAKYRTHWPPGLRHWLKWRRSNNRRKKREGLEKYVKKKCYTWFWPTLLAEKLEEVLWYSVPVETLRRRMTERWTWMPRKPRKIKRHPRKRKDGYWMMIQFDGSYHDWLENWEEMCLLLWVDDATWDAMHARFTKNESINDVISYREEYFEIYGKPSVIYLDRHASYKVNHRVDQFDHTTKTRFQTAMNYLGIQTIFAKSPEWKWRVENRFKLFQDRWIKEFRLAWIKTYKEAEKYLQDKLIPSRNKKFRVEPDARWDYHVPLTDKDIQQIERYFAKRSKRKINKVWVVSYEWNKYVVGKWQSLDWTRDVRVLESHYWNIQIRSWPIQLEFKKWYKYFK